MSRSLTTDKQFSDTEYPHLKLFLLVVIIAYTVSMTVFSYLRYLDFFTSNWDLGIETQMLATSFHHSILFETADFESYGTLSQLEIHSTYLAIPYALLYQLIRSPVLLFTTQSLVVALSTIPLAMIARKLGLSWKGLVFVVLIYLLSFPIIASQFYDFHFESFIPLEFFALFYFVLEKKFHSSLMVIALGSFTMEVFPFLSLAVLLYFFLERGLPDPVKWSSLLENKYRDLYFLAIFSIAIFAIIKCLQIYLIPAVLNNQAGMQYLLSVRTESLIPSSFVPLASLSALAYWLILYVAVGFLPAFHKRHILLSIPWLYETIFLRPDYATPVDQYNFIAMLGLVIGMIYAIREKEKTGLTREFLAVPAATGIIGIAVFSLNGFQLSHVNWAMLPYMIGFSIAICGGFLVIIRGKHALARNLFAGKITTKKAFVTVFLLLAVIEILFGPLSVTSNSHAFDDGYAFSYSPNPEFSGALTLAGMMPADASVIASDNLFPFVDSNPNAYSFFYEPLQNLTYTVYFDFTSNFSFTYVFVDQAQMKDIPAVDISYLESSYGLLAEVKTNLSYPGDIYLYELHYSGNTTLLES